MKKQNILLWLVGLLSGGLLACMIFTNALMAKFSSPIWASFITHGIGALLLLFYLLFTKKYKNLITNIPKIPKWLYLGGIFGAILVITETISINSPLLSAAAIGIFLLGQVILSLIIDIWGLFGMPKKRLSIYKMLELFCIGEGSCILIFYG